MVVMSKVEMTAPKWNKTQKHLGNLDAIFRFIFAMRYHDLPIYMQSNCICLQIFLMHASKFVTGKVLSAAI